MKHPLPLALAPLAAFAFATAGATADPAAAPAAAFPNVTGKNLSGKEFALPAAFEGPLDLVFVAFERKQQGDVDSWKSFADGLKTRYPRLRVYELPTLPRSISFLRGFIDGGMRSGIPDAAARDSTITLYVDKRAYERALQIASEREIAVLLVKPSGEIVWRTTGRFDAAHEPQLDALLAEAK